MKGARESVDNVYCADFETTGMNNYLKDGYVRVYLWSLVSLDGTREYHGYSIETFILKLIQLEATKVWFHNLRFDGSFIVDYLARTGHKYGEEYTCIIDGLNVWYEIAIVTYYGQIKIWDSLKKFPGQKVEDIAHMYKIEGKKEYPDFGRYLPVDYKPYDEEIEYCMQDSRIIAYAMNEEYKQGRTGMTLSSDAFKSVQSTIGGYMGWRSKMPKLSVECDAFIRDSYKGGWVYVNPVYQNLTLENVTVFDVNSLYPHVMRNCELPWGSAIYSEHEPHNAQNYQWVKKFKCNFRIRENYLPTVQIKHNLEYLETEYLTESKDDVMLTMTNVDYELFKKHYYVSDIEDYGYYVMKKRTGLLREYVDYWTNIKIEATKNKEYARRYISKRYLNSPYGKTGMRLDRINKVPIIDEDGDLTFENKEETAEGIYIPYATFVCAQARNITITGAQRHFKDFVYADTDSLHLLGNDHSGLEVDDVKLGCWKIEGQFEKAKYIRPKTYIHADKNFNVQEIKCAGMPDNIKEICTWDKFKDGATFEGKLMQKRVPGGVVLCPTTYQIKQLV